ncbi:hypothetical protein [Clostridium sp. LP20]|uniref:hypothetical protein n=1 Tax=Clostridium sp. LP20 TaxID=3418665 RepID=UPI003EE4E3C9
MYVELTSTNLCSNSITFELSESIPKLNKSDIFCFYNNFPSEITSLKKVDLIGKKYIITFQNSLLPNDILTIYISNCIYDSNILTSAYCEESNNIYINYKIPTVPSNSYKLFIESLNSISFPVEGDSFVICNGIDTFLSEVKSNEYIYTQGENIPLLFELFDEDFNLVPDGNYTVKFKISADIN